MVIAVHEKDPTNFDEQSSCPAEALDGETPSNVRANEQASSEGTSDEKPREESLRYLLWHLSGGRHFRK